MMMLFCIPRASLVMLTQWFVSASVGDLVIRWGRGWMIIQNAATDEVIHEEGAMQEDA
jgi:hypothetical protein